MIDWLFANYHWIVLTLIVHGAVLGTVAYMILLERKIASWVQDRIGPNRVGLGFGLIPWLKDKKMMGLGQPLADGLKFIVKEDYKPAGVDSGLFTLAPIIMIVVVIISIAVIPWGGWKEATQRVDVTGLVEYSAAIRAHTPGDAQYTAVSNAYTVSDRPGKLFVDVVYRWPFQIAHLNIGALYILATLSLAVYGVVIGGWASNNKYSFLGGLRATANMISYEIPLGLSVLCIVVMYGTLDLGEIVTVQSHYWLGWIPAWNVFTQPLAFLMFLICIHAEANRAPFDVAEAEQELVGGYHTEYSSMRFALFFLAEYAGMITTSALGVALFFGGWHLPWLEWLWPALGGQTLVSDNGEIVNVTASLLACIVRAVVFFSKTMGIIFVFMWVRWSLPRFRFDQLMMLAWRALIPISLALLMMTSIVIYLARGLPRSQNVLMGGVEAILFVLANAMLLGAVFMVSQLLPPPPETNRKMAVPNSRFNRTPLPGGPVGAAALDVRAATSVAVNPVPITGGGAAGGGGSGGA